MPSPSQSSGVDMVVHTLSRIATELSEVMDSITVQWTLLSEETDVYQSEMHRLDASMAEVDDKEAFRREQFLASVSRSVSSSTAGGGDAHAHIEAEQRDLAHTFEELKEERSRELLVYLGDAEEVLSRYLFDGVFTSDVFVDYLYIRSRAAENGDASYIRPSGTRALEHQLHTIVRIIEQLASLLGSMCIEPVPSPETQCASIELLCTIVSRSRPLLGEEEWGRIFTEINMSASMEVALSSTLGLYQVTPGDPVVQRLFCTISRCVFVSCAVSGTLASDMLTSDTHVATLLEVLKSLCVQINEVSSDLAEHRAHGSVPDPKDSDKLMHISDAVCNIIATLHILCRLADAAAILTSSHAHHVVVSLLETVIAQHDVHGLPTICGMALQLLNEMTESCFESFSQLLLDDRLCRVLCRDVIAQSPWGPLIEAGCTWLRTCLNQARMHCQQREDYVEMLHGDEEPGSVMRLLSSRTRSSSLCYDFIDKITSRYGIIEALLRVIRLGETAVSSPTTDTSSRGGRSGVNSPTSAANTLFDFSALSHGSTQNFHSGETNTSDRAPVDNVTTIRSATAASACLEALLLSAPHTLALPERLVGGGIRHDTTIPKSFARSETTSTRKSLQFIATISSAVSCLYFRVLSNLPHAGQAAQPPFHDNIMLVHLAHVLALAATFSPRTRALMSQTLSESLSHKAILVLWAGVELGFALAVGDDARSHHTDSWLVIDSRGVLINALEHHPGTRPAPRSQTESGAHHSRTNDDANRECDDGDYLTSEARTRLYRPSSVNISQTTITDPLPTCVNLERIFEQQEGDEAVAAQYRRGHHTSGGGQRAISQQRLPEVTQGVLYCGVQRVMHMACDRIEILSGNHGTSSAIAATSASHLQRVVSSTIQRASDSKNAGGVDSSAPGGGGGGELSRSHLDAKLKASLAMITSLAHHYAGNVAKLKHLESEVAHKVKGEVNSIMASRRGKDSHSTRSRSQSTTFLRHNSEDCDGRRRSLSQHESASDSEMSEDSSLRRLERLKAVKGVQQSARVWSVRDMKESDMVLFRIPLFASVYEAAARRTSPSKSNQNNTTNMGPSKDYSLHTLISNLQSYGEGPLSNHILHLHKELESTPLAWHRRRCLINDLYTHVYPKLLVFVRYIIQTLMERGDAAGKPLFVFIVSDRQEVAIDPSNIVACYHFVGRMV